MVKFQFFTAIKAHDVGEVFQLCWGEVAMGAVDLIVDVAGVDEKYGVFASKTTLGNCSLRCSPATHACTASNRTSKL